MNFSYDRAWADVVAMLRANLALLLTLSGVFLFLPAFALWLFLPAPQGAGTGEEQLQVFFAYYQKNLWAFMIINVISAFGQMIMLVLLIDRTRPTVAEAVTIAGTLFPGYFLANVVSNLATVFGLLLFLVPGLYVLGRFLMLGPVMVDQRLSNPLVALQESWQRTAGVGWRVVGLLLLVGIVGWIATSAATSVLTILISLLLPTSLDAMAAAFATALGGAAFALLILLLSAGIYRQLAPAN